MESAEVNTAIVTPPPGEAAPPSTDPIVSLAEHAAQFDPKRPTEPQTETVSTPASAQPEKTRHRAQSQKAGPEDVPRIAELTKRLREAERRAEEAERRATVRPEPERREPTPVAPSTTAPTKPTWKAFEEQIGAKYDTWGDAQDAYVDARDTWKDESAKVQQQTTQATQAAEAELTTYAQRVAKFAETATDFHQVMDRAKQTLDDIPDLLFRALIKDDNGPQDAYTLVQTPERLAQMCLLTEGKPVTDANVAYTRRLLASYRTPAAAIGSAAPSVPQHTPAPRPPNPMRTAPMTTGDEPPTGDHSVAEHEQHFGRKRR